MATIKELEEQYAALDQEHTVREELLRATKNKLRLLVFEIFAAAGFEMTAVVYDKTDGWVGEITFESKEYHSGAFVVATAYRKGTFITSLTMSSNIETRKLVSRGELSKGTGRTNERRITYGDYKNYLVIESKTAKK